jgi:hypothetical protein
MHCFRNAGAKLPGRGMHCIANRSAYLTGRGMDRLGDVRIELGRRCRGSGLRWWLGCSCTLAEIAIHGEFTPVGYGKRGRFLCHRVSSILILLISNASLF